MIIRYKVLIERTLDMDIRVHPLVRALHDNVVTAIPPNFVIPDAFVFTLRDAEALRDSSIFAKDETKSLFQVFDFDNENKQAHTLFVGSDVRAVARTSEEINRPLSDARIQKSVHVDSVSLPEMDQFITISIDPSLWEKQRVADFPMGVSYTLVLGIDSAQYALPYFGERNYKELHRTFAKSTCLPIPVVLKSGSTTLPLSIAYQCTFILLLTYSTTLTFNIKPINITSSGVLFSLYIDGVLTRASGSEANPIASHAQYDYDIYLERGMHIVTFRSAQVVRDIASNPTILSDLTMLYINNNPASTEFLNSIGVKVYALPQMDIEPPVQLSESELVAPSTVTNSEELLDAFTEFPVVTLIRAGAYELQNKFLNTRTTENKIKIQCRNTILDTTEETISFTKHDLIQLWKETTGNEIEDAVVKLANKCIAPCNETDYTCSSGYISEYLGGGVFINSEDTITIERADKEKLHLEELVLYTQTTDDSVTLLLKFEEPEQPIHEIYEALTCSTLIEKKLNLTDEATIELKLATASNERTTAHILQFDFQIRCNRISIKMEETEEKDDGSLADKAKVRVNLVTYDKLKNYCYSLSNIQTKISDKNLRPTKFDDITSIPAIFKPELVRQDMKLLTSYIMFSIHGAPPSFTTYGYYYVIENHDDYASAGAICTSTYGIPKDIAQIGIFDDEEKTMPLDWAFAIYNHETNTIEPADFTELRIKLKNEGTSAVTNPTVQFYLPNYGYAWTSSSGYTCGITKEGAKTDQLSEWNTYWVRYTHAGTINPGDEVEVTFTRASSFSPISNVGDPITPDILVIPLTSFTHATLINYTLNPGRNRIFTLEDSSNPPNTTATYNLIKTPVVGRLLLRNIAGGSSDFEVMVDLADLMGKYGRLPLQAVNARTREPLETVGINRDGTPTKSFSQWDGTVLAIKGIIDQEILPIDFIFGDFSTNPTTFMGETIRGLIAYYPLADASLKDKTPRNWDGEFKNAAPTTDKEGSPNRATYFDGTTVGVIPHVLHTATMVVTFWFKTNQDGGLFCLSKDLGPSSDTNFDIYIQGGVLKFRYNGEEFVTPATVTDDSWHFCAVLASPHIGCRIYLDGSQIYENPHLLKFQGLNDFYESTLIGFAHDAYFTGSMNEVRIHRTVMNDALIKHLQRIYDLYVPKNVIFNWQEYKTDDLLMVRPTGIVTSLYDTLDAIGQPFWVYKYAGVSGVVKQLVT